MRIVLCYPVESQHIAQIQAVAPDWEVIDAGQERIAELLPTADIYCGHAKVPVPWDEVVAGGKLQWIQSSAAGMDHCLVPPVVKSDILVTSASGVLANQVADHTMALLCGSLRRLPVFFEAMDKREFIRRPTKDLHHTTVGVVGLGGNGRRLAEVLSVFNTTILATDWFPVNKPPHVAELLAADRLDEILPRCDSVILAVPLNEVTRGMFDARRIGLMKPGSVLVNMARGPIVVEEALVDALESGHLWGAGLDVTETEPLPEGSRLWNAPNLVLTPHVGGQCKTRIEDMTDFFCENLRRYRAGEPLKNVTDKELGFPFPVAE
ncbi:D-2-hydroxyacid dehydrogenase [Aeoliella sp. ICT_H6.2]|uniref:D-2-hydroxyacid dehydrogenase n=1 Tax=Aeoliella straminimaris TaxID=2954799 RepID=A0A9X2JJ34_9BACT|nr:D-2-hydroxyacid dehydrogenase [Aeoliella straminimaris]MCO6046333.1 D-2-hydroxyacid dehydrogenase [Aeoliella straminimaris]